MRYALAILICLAASSALAHEVRPAYLELHQTSPDAYEVLWKVPSLGDDLRLGLYVHLPEGCSNVAAPRGAFSGRSYTERWNFRREGGLSGGTIHIAGLSGTMTDALVRLERLDGSIQMARLTPDAPSFIVEAAPRPAQIARTYLALGVEHILLGIDHLLFVLGLLLLVSGVRRLLATVTAFTLAHSVTLSAAALGFVHVPPPPVEAVIALSILFVATEIIRRHRAGPDAAPTLAQRQPWLIAFSFGLLHGLGFAGALSEVGLPQTHIPLALLLFSCGVELGHFGFIAIVLALILAFRWLSHRLPAHTLAPQRLATIRLLPPYAIGTIATFWLIQRLAAF